MSIRYCHNCGSQQPVFDAKFCVHCGTSLSSLTEKPAPPPTPPKQNRSHLLAKPSWANRDEDDDDYIDRIQQLDVRIDKLEVEISGPPNVQVEKLGAIAGKEPTVNTNEFRQGPYANLTPEQVREQFALEAGSRVEGKKTHNITVDE